MEYITYKQVKQDKLSDYDTIPMKIEINEIYEIHKTGKGMEGIKYSFEKKKVAPYEYDFTVDDPVTGWAEKFDIQNWAFFLAYDEGKAIGGAAVAARTDEIRMLEGRDDIVVLWDLRVDDGYRHRGIGHKLFNIAVQWARENNYQMMKIECQNTNIPACNFYQKQGAELCIVNENGYKDSEEAMLLWYLKL